MQYCSSVTQCIFLCLLVRRTKHAECIYFAISVWYCLCQNRSSSTCANPYFLYKCLMESHFVIYTTIFCWFSLLLLTFYRKSLEIWIGHTTDRVLLKSHVDGSRCVASCCERELVKFAHICQGKERYFPAHARKWRLNVCMRVYRWQAITRISADQSNDHICDIQP